MSRPLLVLLLGVVLGGSPAYAQIVLPGAAPPAPGGATAPTPKRKKSAAAMSKGGEPAPKSAKLTPLVAPDVARLSGQPLFLNGKAGLLQISGDDNAVRIDKLRLAGESVSDPSQHCEVEIVGEKPIEATSAERPDGLQRFEANVPACPFAFDVLNGSALVPSQISACVFKAADCQTNPSGLWGPGGSALEKDAAEIAKERTQAEKTMGKLVRAIESRAETDAEAANLLRDQRAFPGQRDDACRDYLNENVHGFCAARLTEARTALLQARLDALGPAAVAKPEKKKKKPGKSGKAP